MNQNIEPNKDIAAWLTLAHAPKFGHKAWQTCLQYYDSPSGFCQLDAKQLRQFGLNEQTVTAIKQPNLKMIERSIHWAQQPKQFLITLADKALYPQQLSEISAPPPLLYVKGDLNCLHNTQIAMVGTRKASYSALEIAHHFAYELASSGIHVTSGLATGVDAAAHRGTLSANAKTLAVLGNGIDITYPPQNRDLAAKISESGAIISEFTLSSPPRAKQFPQRNRIISGLSLGTLVVEAAQRSGSLITARLAMEQGREVFAIPGSILNPMTQGCHHLIQQGAKLTTCLTDILDELTLKPPQLKYNPPLKLRKPAAKLENTQQKLLECIGCETASFEQLVDRTGFSTQKVSAMLCNLTLNGYIRKESTGYSRATR